MFTDQTGECTVCGRRVDGGGYRTYDPRLPIVSTNFGDHWFLKRPASPVTCATCESVFRDPFRALTVIVVSRAGAVAICPEGTARRFRATVPLARVEFAAIRDLVDLLLDPPQPPFLFGMNARKINGTHFLPLCQTNYSRDQFVINHYSRAIHVNRDFVQRFFDALVDAAIASGKVSALTERNGRKYPVPKALDLQYLSFALLGAGQISTYKKNGNGAAAVVTKKPVVPILDRKVIPLAIAREAATAENIAVVDLLLWSLSK